MNMYTEETFKTLEELRKYVKKLRAMGYKLVDKDEDSSGNYRSYWFKLGDDTVYVSWKR